MNPQQLQIQELQRQVKILTDFMLSLKSVPTVDPQVAETIRLLAGTATLAGLSDVAFSSLSNGQVVKYNSGTQKWFNGTDNV